MNTSATSIHSYSTATELVENYYRLVQRRDFDAAQQLVAPGEIRDGWWKPTGNYKDNLRELRSYDIGVAFPDEFGIYDQPAIEPTSVEVTLDIEWKQELSSKSGERPRHVRVARLAPTSPLWIIAEGFG